MILKGRDGWRWLVLPGCIVSLAVLLAVGTWFFISRAAVDQYHVAKQVHWNLTVRNNSNRALRDIEVFSFAPLPDTWQQLLVELTGTHSVELLDQGSAQPYGRLLLEAIPPYGQRNIRLQAEVAMASGHANRERSDLDSLLEPEPLIESDDEQVLRVAHQLDQGDSALTARAIYDWLITEVEYTGYDPTDRGALHALKQRTGDCTEYAALAVALARALRIPARMVNGYVVNEGGRLSPFSFHAWAEIRLDNRWLILDAQEKYFDPAPETYLATHYGTSRSRQADWTRFHSPDSRVAIEMQ